MRFRVITRQSGYLVFSFGTRNVIPRHSDGEAAMRGDRMGDLSLIHQDLCFNMHMLVSLMQLAVLEENVIDCTHRYFAPRGRNIGPE